MTQSASPEPRGIPHLADHYSRPSLYPRQLPLMLTDATYARISADAAAAKCSKAAIVRELIDEAYAARATPARPE